MSILTNAKQVEHYIGLLEGMRRGRPEEFQTFSFSKSQVNTDTIKNVRQYST